MKQGRTIFKSLLIITLVSSLVYLHSYAYFYDREKSSGNAFASATLDLKIKDPKTGQWVDDPNVPGIDAWCSDQISNMEPGDYSIITIPIQNAGRIGGRASFCFNNVLNWGGDISEPESIEDPANSGGLGRLIWINLKLNNGSGPVLVGQGWLEDLNGQELVAPDLLGSGEQASWLVEMYFVDYNWPDNKIQGDYLTFDVIFGLKQD